MSAKKTTTAGKLKGNAFRELSTGSSTSNEDQDWTVVSKPAPKKPAATAAPANKLKPAEGAKTNKPSATASAAKKSNDNNNKSNHNKTFVAKPDSADDASVASGAGSQSGKSAFLAGNLIIPTTMRGRLIGEKGSVLKSFANHFHVTIFVNPNEAKPEDQTVVIRSKSRAAIEETIEAIKLYLSTNRTPWRKDSSQSRVVVEDRFEAAATPVIAIPSAATTGPSTAEVSIKQEATAAEAPPAAAKVPAAPTWSSKLSSASATAAPASKPRLLVIGTAKSGSYVVTAPTTAASTPEQGWETLSQSSRNRPDKKSSKKGDDGEAEGEKITFEMKVPRYTVREIIGVKGATKEIICKATNTHISVPKMPDHAKTGGGKNDQELETVTIRGNSQEDIDKATAVINDLLKHHCSEVTHPNTEYVRMDFPDMYWRALIGSKGSRIRNLEKQFSVRIYLPSTYLSKLVVIGENRDLIEDAMCAIDEIMDMVDKWKAEDEAKAASEAAPAPKSAEEKTQETTRAKSVDKLIREYSSSSRQTSRAVSSSLRLRETSWEDSNPYPTIATVSSLPRPLPALKASAAPAAKPAGFSWVAEDEEEEDEKPTNGRQSSWAAKLRTSSATTANTAVAAPPVTAARPSTATAKKGNSKQAKGKKSAVDNDDFM